MRPLVTTLTLLLIASQTQAVTFSGTLNPGDTFHLVFVTRDTRDATSSNINDYNNFVQAQAVLAGLDNIFSQPITWKTIGSTATVDARDNIGVIVSPIFNPAGDLVALNEADLFDGSPLANPILLDQFMTSPPSNTVFTGSDIFGTDFGAPLGSNININNITARGRANNNGNEWIILDSDSPANRNSFYALSSPIIFQPAQTLIVPEPISATLIPLALAPLLMRRRREG